MKMTIGSNIRRLRTAKNITQEQLSDAMNVTCAAVSKWERGETFPDITLLQPLAYYFGVTLDELMGYNIEKVKKEIDEVIELYRKYWYSDYQKARDIIVKAYEEYPNDYMIMHYYMWNIGGDMADNDPSVLIEHKDEFLTICDRILGGCTEESLRLNAWNMRAKILHAEGKTDEALEIYKTKFPDWYSTCDQKCEQLFVKDTDEYYYYVQRNMYELIDFAADKLGRVVFFNRSLSLDEKADKALKYGDLLMNAYNETTDPFFLVLCESFLGRMENDLIYRGGTDDEVIAVMEKHLIVVQKIAESINETPHRYKLISRLPDREENILEYHLNCRLNPPDGRRAELLKNPAYIDTLNKFR